MEMKTYDLMTARELWEFRNTARSQGAAEVSLDTGTE